jgi:DNA-binding NtrC family response regulator
MMPSVLIVDDDPLLLSLLSFSLAANYAVVIADGVEQVRSLLVQNQPAFPEVVILDLGLPPMPYTPDIGLSLLSEIVATFPKCKVIVLTGQDQEEVAFRALSLGAFDFITKPATPEQLIAAIKRAFLFIKQQSQAKQQGIHAIRFDVSEDAGLKQVRNEAEKQLFLQVWQQSNENVHETARRLGIKRENVYYLMDKFGVMRADS